MGTVNRWHGYQHGGVQHRAYWQTGHLSHHSVVYDHRGPYAISHDRFVRPWYRGYRARYNWAHFYPRVGWPALWGIDTFSVVSGVTCEAANSVTGALYPVSASGVGAWNNVTVDSVLGQALDECAANAGPGVCVPAQPACTYY